MPDLAQARRLPPRRPAGDVGIEVMVVADGSAPRAVVYQVPDDLPRRPAATAPSRRPDRHDGAQGARHPLGVRRARTTRSIVDRLRRTHPRVDGPNAQAQSEGNNAPRPATVPGHAVDAGRPRRGAQRGEQSNTSIVCRVVSDPTVRPRSRSSSRCSERAPRREPRRRGPVRAHRGGIDPGPAHRRLLSRRVGRPAVRRTGARPSGLRPASSSRESRTPGGSRSGRGRRRGLQRGRARELGAATAQIHQPRRHPRARRPRQRPARRCPRSMRSRYAAAVAAVPALAHESDVVALLGQVAS